MGNKEQMEGGRCDSTRPAPHHPPAALIGLCHTALDLCALLCLLPCALSVLGVTLGFVSLLLGLWGGTEHTHTHWCESMSGLAENDQNILHQANGVGHRQHKPAMP